LLALRYLLISSFPQHVPEGFHHQHLSTNVAVATDMEQGVPGKYVLPSPATAKALAVPAPPATKEGKPLTNGAPLDTDENKRWVERTGWAPRFGLGDHVEGESFADHQTWIESKLDDKFFGGRFPRLCGRNNSNFYFRLVSQYRCDHLRVSRIVGSCHLEWGTCVDFPDHGYLWHLLPNFNSQSATKLSRRCQEGNGQKSARVRHGKFRMD